MSPQRLQPLDVRTEFEGVALNDARLDKRVQRVVEQVAVEPSASFPSLMSSIADREALYRLLANEKVTLEALLAPHVAATKRRISGSIVRVAHDTTTLVYDGERDGLGAIPQGGRGYFAHCALAIDVSEERVPLGILGVSTYAHTEAKQRRKQTESQQSVRCHHTPREEKISARWEQLAIDVSAKLPKGVEAIHVMDREADCFAMLAALLRHGLRFVVRGTGKRLTKAEKEPLSDTMAAQEGRIFRRVIVNRRGPRGRAPARPEHEVELAVRWARVEFKRPQWAQAEERSIALNVVHVYEPAPLEGLQSIEWYLLTSEKVDSLEDAAQVVDHYRARWVIEEYFKALKTGCAIESRQLTSYDALVRALGLFLPIAWKLLALRSMSCSAPDAPAEKLFADDELVVLRAVLRKRRTDYRFPERPTIRDVMLAIAALGGHIKNNGDPGWLVLGRGFQLFSDALDVWLAMTCDQS